MKDYSEFRGTSCAVAVALLLQVLCFAAGFPQEGEPIFPSTSELKELSLDDLLQLEVTSVSKQSEPLDEAASAIQVITGEDIRRSGAVNLVDALRLAPNLNVQQINSYARAVSARGFNALFANKLLVLIDGRFIYTPLYAGVLWDAQNVLLEDLDRVEVISGPGGTLWGANAVNGVINVVTKSARETQGLYVSGAAGSFLEDFRAVRYGGKTGEDVFYRVYGQRFDYEGTRSPDGSENQNAWHMTQGGFRVDYEPTKVSNVSVQGDVYVGLNTTRNPPILRWMGKICSADGHGSFRTNPIFSSSFISIGPGGAIFPAPSPTNC